MTAGPETDVKWIWTSIVIMGAPYVFTLGSSLWHVMFKKTEGLTCRVLVVVRPTLQYID